MKNLKKKIRSIFLIILLSNIYSYTFGQSGNYFLGKSIIKEKEKNTIKDEYHIGFIKIDPMKRANDYNVKITLNVLDYENIEVEAKASYDEDLGKTSYYWNSQNNRLTSLTISRGSLNKRYIKICLLNNTEKVMYLEILSESDLKRLR